MGDYAYQVLVKRTKDFLTYTSNYSNRIDVKLLSTDVKNIFGEEPTANNSAKVVYNGQLLIIREGKVYNVMGMEL